MSSTSFRKPEFRLHLGYPDVILTCADGSMPVGTAATDTAAFGADLFRLAAEVIRARGRLVVLLPEAEVWRGRLDLEGRTRLARRREARELVAARLGEPADGVAVVLGRRGPERSVAVAGVRRETLADTRRLLAGVGLRPAAIIGAGAFPGFDAPPRLGGWGSLRAALPPAPRRGTAVALGAGAVAAMAALVLALPGEPPAAPPPVTTAAVAVEPPAAAQPAPEPTLRADLRPRPAPPLRLLRSERPVARPKPVSEPVVTVATRNVPLLFSEPRREAVPELRLAELTTARARMIDAMMDTPLRRPAAAPAPILAPAAVPDDMRPMRRPSAAAVALPAPLVSEASAPRPRPRPAAAEAMVVAALAPTAAVAGLAAAAAVPAPPPARPAERRAAPVKVAKAAPAPVVVRPAAAPSPTATPRPAAVVPVRQVVAAPVRQKVVAQRPAAAAPKPATVATARATQTVGLSRGSVSLIGVFGGASERHALVLLPSGAIQRVSPGDTIQGAQVAAVGADSVRLRGGGRDTLLRLPD